MPEYLEKISNQLFCLFLCIALFAVCSTKIHFARAESNSIAENKAAEVNLRNNLSISVNPPEPSNESIVEIITTGDTNTCITYTLSEHSIDYDNNVISIIAEVFQNNLQMIDYFTLVDTIGTLPLGEYTTTASVTYYIWDMFNGMYVFHDYETANVNFIVSEAINLSISGSTNYMSYELPVPNAVFTLIGDNSYTTTSDSEGNYVFSSLSIDDYNLTASKDNDVNGITAYDAARVAQYAADLYVFDEYQLIAGDVTGDGAVTSFDAATIARYAAQLPQTYNTGEWTFIPEEYAYNPLESDQTQQDFTAILYGDVTGNWSSQGVNDTNSDTPVPEVIAFQFTIETEMATGIAFSEKLKSTLPQDWNVATNQINKSTEFICGYSATPISEKELLLILNSFSVSPETFTSFYINDILIDVSRH